jgi:hypothetical protein
LAGVTVAASIVAIIAAGAAITIAVVSVATARVAIAAAVVSVVSPVVAIVAPVGAVATTVKAVVGITSAVIASVVAVSTAAIIAVVPRAGTDKDAADKIVGTIEAIRRAFVRVGVVVSVGTNGSYADVARTVAWADSDAHRNLSMGVTCSKHENTE